MTITAMRDLREQRYNVFLHEFFVITGFFKELQGFDFPPAVQSSNGEMSWHDLMEIPTFSAGFSTLIQRFASLVEVKVIFN